MAVELKLAKRFHVDDQHEFDLISIERIGELRDLIIDNLRYDLLNGIITEAMGDIKQIELVKKEIHDCVFHEFRASVLKRRFLITSDCGNKKFSYRHWTTDRQLANFEIIIDTFEFNQSIKNLKYSVLVPVEDMFLHNDLNSDILYVSTSKEGYVYPVKMSHELQIMSLG